MNKLLLLILVMALISTLSYAVDISACTNLAASTTYRMTGNVNSINGSCMNITGNSVTLNCAGYYINYTQGYGINNSGGYDYLRIENCTIFQNYTGAGSSSGYGIYLQGSIYNNITNNTITTGGNSSHGMYVYSSSQRNNITNNSVTTSGVSAYGIYVYTSSTYNNLTQNNIWAKGNSSYAVYMYTSSDYNQIINNTLLANGSSSYTLHSRTTYNNITNNTINVSGSASNPVYLRSAQYNNIINNTIRSALSGIDGVLIYGTGTTKNNFSSNYFITTTAVPITFSSTTGTPTTCETDYNQTIETTNTEQGSPILFIFNQSNYELSGTSNYSFVLAACSPSLNIHDNNFTSSGIDIWQSNDSIVRNNRITLTGSYKDGIAARYGQGHDIYRNNITVSTGAYGIYVSTANTTEIYENNISRTGSSGYGLYEYNGINHTTYGNNIAMTGTGTSAYLVYYYYINNSIFYNNNISQGSSGSSSYGVYFRQNTNNSFYNNNISSAAATAYGLYIYGSDNNTIYGNKIQSNLNYSVFIANTTVSNVTNNIFFNNIFNGSNYSVGWSSTSNKSSLNYWNTTLQTGVRLLGNGYLLGGNYYTNSSGTGFSDTCTDANVDGFCDAYFNVSASNSCTGADCELNNTDFLAYSNFSGLENRSYFMSTNAGGEFSIIKDGIRYNATASGNINDGQWHLLTATYDGSYIKLYRDGYLVQTLSYSDGIQTSYGSVELGGGNGVKLFNGSMDEIRIYNRSLEAGEIWNEYNSQKSKFILNYTRGYENKTVYLTLNKYDETNSANLYLYGLNTSGSYPSNVRIYINGTLDKYYGGTFLVGTSNTTTFSDNTSLTNVSISSTGYAYKYVSMPAEAIAKDTCNLSFIAKKNEAINYYDTFTNESYRKVNSTSYWVGGVTINRTLDSNISNSRLVGYHCYCNDVASCASSECTHITADNYTGVGVLGNGIGYMISEQNSYDGYNLTPNYNTYATISSSIARGLSVGGCYKWTNYAYANYTLNCTSTDIVNLNAMLYAYPVNITDSYANDRIRYAAYIYFWNYTSASWQTKYSVDNSYGYPWAMLNISGSYALDSSTCSGGRAQVQIQAKAKIRSYVSDDCTSMWDVCTAGGYDICGTNTTIDIYTINTTQSVYNDFSTSTYSETGYSTPVYTSSNNIPEVEVTINYTGNLSFYVSNNGGANTSILEYLIDGNDAYHKYVTFGGKQYFFVKGEPYLFKYDNAYVYSYVYFPSNITALEYFNGRLFVGTDDGYIYYSASPDTSSSYSSAYLPSWNAGWTGGVSAMAGCDYSSTHEMVFFSTDGEAYWWVFGDAYMTYGLGAYATDAVSYSLMLFNSGDSIYYMACPLTFAGGYIDYDAIGSITNFGGFAPGTSSWAFGNNGLYYRSGISWSEVGSTDAGDVTGIVYNGTNIFFSSNSNGTVYKYQGGVTEAIASQQGINNASLLMLDTDLYFVGTTASETYLGKYIPNSYSAVTTASGSVDNITFKTSGTNITWKVIMNSTGSRTVGPNLTMVNITIGGRYPNNLSIKVGYLTSTYDTAYSSTGEMNETNGTINVTFDKDDINAILDVCSINVTTGNCDVPITFMSDTEGSFEIQNILFNYTMNPNPISLNITLINRYLNESSVGNISIPISIESETNGTINVSSINVNYNGSTIHGITAYSTNTTISRLIQIFYSVWSYAFPSGIEYLEFLPSYPTSQNVTPWGQGEFVPILNITHLNTTNNIYSDFKISVNESLSCVNISASNSSTKGGVINSTFSQLYNSLYNNFGLWLWADFACSYNNWYLFNPGLDIKACCQNCICD